MSINYLDKTGLEHIGDIANYKKRNIDYTTYTGTDLEIEDTLENKIDFNNLYGKTEQDSYEGKNLFDVTEFENNLVTRKIKNDNGEEVSDYNSTYSTYMIPVKANQSYHFYGYFQRIYLYDSNNEWIRRTSAYDGLMDIDFIPTQDGYVQLQIHNNTYNTNKSKEQIEEGIKTDYEPYVGGTASPNPDYPQEIKTVTGRQVVKITGKNLFDKSAVTLGKIVSRTDGTLSNAANYNASDYIPMKENTTYTLTSLNFNRWYSACYDENKNYIGYVENEATFTTISGTKYMRFTVYNNLMDTAMIVEGNTVPDTYEEYKEQVYELNLGNLCNEFVSGYYVDSSGNIVSGNGWQTTDEYIEVKPNTEYVFKAISSGTRCLIGEYDDNKTFISTRQEIVIGNTYTTRSTTKYIKFSVPSDATSIEMYRSDKTPIELCKIGDYQDSIKKSTGKNLFDKSNVNIINGNMPTQNGTISSHGADRTLYIPCEPNTTYSFRKLVNTPYSRNQIAECSELPAIGVSYTNRDIQYNAEEIAHYTTSANAKYLLWTFYSTSSTNYTLQEILDSIQIEKGSTATDYEPYGVGKWYVDKKIGKAVLDGSENTWYMHTNTTNNIYTYYIGFSDMEITTADILSNYYHYVAGCWNISSKEEGQIATNGKSVYFNSKLTSLNEFKEWLSTHNTTVYYVLATSTAEEITDEEFIEQLNDLYDAFYMNSKTYINVEGDLPIVLEINHDEPRFLNLIDKGELQKYIMDLEKRVAILESQITE